MSELIARHGGWIGVELAIGVALFLWSAVGFCRTLGLGASPPRLVAGAAAKPLQIRRHS